MGRHYRSRYRPPGYRTARLVLVPLIAAILAVLSLFTDTEDRSWSTPPGSTATSPSSIPATAEPAPWVNVPATPAPVTMTASDTLSLVTAIFSGSGDIQVATTQKPQPSSAPSTKLSDQHKHRNFSARSDPIPESIQGCQRSAASCFESGGLGELTSNLQVMKIDPVTGRFCFSFQPECSR